MKYFFDANPGYVLIKPLDIGSSGVWKQGGQEKEAKMGEIIAKGSSVLTESGNLYDIPNAVGEIVWHEGYSASPVKYDGVEYRIVKFRDIFGRVHLKNGTSN